jgi:7-cyano-7-deazaguanine reductase
MEVNLDKFFEELKRPYGITSKELADKIETRKTTQVNKPVQVFPNPLDEETTGGIHIEFSEFTSKCPKTGQPDFAKVTIDYIPNRVCIELKSLKLYLNSYRDEGHFYEEVTELIFRDLVKVLEPLSFELIMEFNARGGMPVRISKVWRG